MRTNWMSVLLIATLLGACGQQASPPEPSQRVMALQNCGDPPDMLVVLDRSGSMNGAKWTSAVSAVTNVVTTFDGQIRFGLELFPSDNYCAVAAPQVGVDDETGPAIVSTLNATSAMGNTPMVQALQQARSYLGSVDPAKAKHVLLVTDGMPNCSYGGSQAISAVAALAGDGISTFVVGFGTGVDPTLLNQMAQAGGTGSYYQANSQSDLDAALGAIASFVSCCGNGQLDQDEECDDGNNLSGDGCSADCKDENLPPVAQCQGATVSADAQCQGCASVDNGSYDPDGDSFTVALNPTCDYPLGDTSVTLTITDAYGLTDQCTATVSVVDDTPPVIDCNAPATITPPDAPISFAATATDNCGLGSVVVQGYDCWTINGAGKLVDKTKSCVVAYAGDTLTISDSGGVGDHITWTVVATDASGNQTSATCEVEVLNPSR